jgi:hypothetical protein
LKGCVAKLGWLLLVAGCNEVGESGAELVRSVLDVFDLTPIEGAVMCHVETGNCAVSDADGIVMLEVPPNEEISWTLSSDGYGPILTGGLSTGSFLGPARTGLWPDAFLVEQSRRLDTRYPPNDTGMINIFLPNAPFPGVTFELRDATGERFYADEEGNWDRSLTETTSFERNGFAGAGFVEVPSGEFEIEVGGTVEQCVPFSGWPGDGTNRVRVPVKERFITYVVLSCTRTQQTSTGS